ncbi:uncharacterized protein EDB91DRAFT_1147423 [Suillus paluster]|uniref:uncharacterized protein n=1 Tax=Suillus paluster TaxID=48578 RepID=UPI001B877201|nr:uncharacterized protein EDB91DRAFT_1147423 [Suillus paluster]KAG1734072.1 hypothetical protein EDB91DRAFT_1147423 [Suillus paluster]
MSEAKEPTTAEAPFNNPDCDIILRSTDGVHFHVFKLILSLMSPVFKDMFTLPQNNLQSDVLSVPVIPVAESSTTLKSLLLLCYPATTPTFVSWNDANAMMKAATKYDMQGALSRAGDLITAQFLPDHSLDLYALSCRFGWEHNARVAATSALKIKDLGRPSGAFDGMEDITALDYHRLLVYHYNCSVRCSSALSSTVNMQWRRCTCRNSSIKMLQVGNSRDVGIAPWFDEYLVSSGKELFARPCESTLRESTSYHRAIVKAAECSSCRSSGNVVESMDTFRALYIARVKKVVAAVSFPS